MAEIASSGASGPLPSRQTRRIIGDSIAARIFIAVLGGLILTQLAGYLLFTGERLQLFPLADTRKIEAVLDRSLDRVLAAPAEARAAAAASLTIPAVSAVLTTHFAPTGAIFDPPPMHAIRERLTRRAAGRFDLLLVEAPFPPGAGPEPQRFRLWLRLADGSWLVLTVPASLLREPDILHLVLWWGLSLLGAIPLSLFVAQRLTAPLRRFSAAAERLGIDLTDSPLPLAGPGELRAAAAAINAMQARIKRFVNDRTEMLAAISHDLRTPISRLRLRTEALASGAEHQRMVADLALMEQMIAATLDFARDANAGEESCRIDLASLVESLCADLADLGKAALYIGLRYLEFTCRPMALARAIRNVLENAVEYGGAAEANLNDRGDGIEIIVTDRGPGIPEAEQARVFEPFTRLDRARSTQHEGVGLGLAIARNILRAHGGDVTLRNRPEGGLEVTLWLPRPQNQ